MTPKEEAATLAMALPITDGRWLLKARAGGPSAPTRRPTPGPASCRSGWLPASPSRPRGTSRPGRPCRHPSSVWSSGSGGDRRGGGHRGDRDRRSTGARHRVGSWPGRPREAVRTVRDLLVDGEGTGIPHLPEIPGRGPGADIIGRGAGMSVDLPVDLQPSGWRFVDRPGARRRARHPSCARTSTSRRGVRGLRGAAQGPGRRAVDPRGLDPAHARRALGHGRARRPTWRRRWPTASARTSPTSAGSCRAPTSSSSSTSRRCPRSSRARSHVVRFREGCAPSTRRSPRACSGRCSPRTTGRPSCTAAIPPRPAAAAGHRRGRARRSTSPPPRRPGGSRWRPRSTAAPGVCRGAPHTDGSGTDTAARALVLKGSSAPGSRPPRCADSS